MFSEKEVKEACLEYFNGDEIAADKWMSKYCLKNDSGEYLEKTPDDMHKRLAREFERIEENYPNPMSFTQIYELLKDFRYIIPQGSPMYGIGNDNFITSLSNCFVIGSNGDSDSYGSIMRTDEEQVQLMKRRGGVGHDISHLRPSGSLANNSALGGNAGAVLYMERFSHSTREVSQDGRRGALMLSISVKHPDAEKFIDIKMDTNKVTGANVSVKITTEFMNAVKSDGDFIQCFPIDLAKEQFASEFPGGIEDIPYNKLIKGISKNTYCKKIKARKLWDKVIYNAWRSAEPGVLFWDKIIKESPADCYEGFKTVSTNPCLTGDTIVAVADGRNGVTIKELTEEGKDIPVYCSDSLGNLKIRTLRNPRITGYNQKIYKITLDSGDCIRVTGNHKFYLKNKEIKEAKDLLKGDKLHILSRVKEISESNKQYLLHSNGDLFKEHCFIVESFEDKKLEKGIDVHHKDFNSFNNQYDNLIKLTKDEHNKVHNKSYPGELNPNFSGITNENLLDICISLTKKLGRRISLKEYEEYKLPNFSDYRCNFFNSTLSGFLRNIANDLFLDKNLVDFDTRLVKKYKEAIDNGYKSKISNSKVLVEKKCEFCNKLFWSEYDNREVSFCSQSHAVRYLNNKRWHGSKDLQEIESEFYNHKVLSVEEDGYEDVYNGTVDEFHNLFIGGFNSNTRLGYERQTFCLTAQCGEIPLCPYDSCRLLAINLYSYVENKFTNKSYFNWSKFIMHAYFSQRLMDDLVDLEIEKLDKIIEKIKSDPEPDEIKSVELNLWEKVKEKAIQGRRTGLGITAEGDMLAALGLKYGTKEATEFSVSVHKQLAKSSYESSIDLAEERDCFPIWDLNKEKSNPFIDRILSSFNETYTGYEHPIVRKYKNVGRRNISNLTIAPTGTTSLMSQTTSGIEPLFTPFYIRRTKLSQDAKEFDFVDNVGDKWSEYKVYHVPFIEWYRTQIINEVDDFHVWYDGAGLSDKEIVSFLNEIDKPLLDIIIEASPYYKATSNDVDYFEKVRMQGEIQKWVDHSISVTINMPEHTSVEVVGQCYELAYDSGCKGMTVYRDNSRSGVLIKNDEKPKEGFKYNDSFKRPRTVKCDIYRKTVLKKDWMIVVGLEDSGKPIEIFAFEDVDNVTFPKVIQKGEVTKIQSRIYQLKGEHSGKTYVLPDIVSLISIDDKSDTRKYSLMLRHGIHPKYIVEQIEEYATVVSFDKAIQRVLKNYLDLNGLKKNPCPVCGLELMRVEGCEKCSCGYSRC